MWFDQFLYTAARFTIGVLAIAGICVLALSIAALAAELML